MPILQDFCQAFEQAIREYENEWTENRISIERQRQIQNLRSYLTQCQNPNNPINILTVRQEMVQRVRNMPFEFAEFFLGTRLNKTLEEKVLNLHRFSEPQLIITQYIEIQSIYQAQIVQKDRQINLLTDQIDRLLNNPNKESVHPTSEVTQLLDELTDSPEDIAYLKVMNQKLTFSLKELLPFKQKYELLKKDYDILEKEYNALHTEREKTSTNDSQDKKSTNYALPLFN